MVVASLRVHLQLAGALRTPHSVNDEIILEHETPTNV